MAITERYPVLSFVALFVLGVSDSACAGELTRKTERFGRGTSEGYVDSGGSKSGLWRSTDAKGAKFSEQEWSNGALEGTSTQWSATGTVLEKGSFRGGKKEGVWTTWYESGEKSSETRFSGGKKEGIETRWSRGGARRSEADYKAGRLLRLTQFDPRGVKIAEELHDEGGAGYVRKARGPDFPEMLISPRPSERLKLAATGQGRDPVFLSYLIPSLATAAQGLFYDARMREAGKGFLHRAPGLASVAYGVTWSGLALAFYSAGVRHTSPITLEHAWDQVRDLPAETHSELLERERRSRFYLEDVAARSENLAKAAGGFFLAVNFGMAMLGAMEGCPRCFYASSLAAATAAVPPLMLFPVREHGTWRELRTALRAGPDPGGGVSGGLSIEGSW